MERSRASTAPSISRCCGSADGHSLAELLAALAILAVVLAGIFIVLRSGAAAYQWGALRIESQQSARIALDRIVRELREAGYDPTGAGIDAIVAAEPARVTFDRDLNGNGRIDPTSERVTFVLRAGDSVLRRDAGAGAQPIIEHVRGLALTYLDAADIETADPRAVRSMRIRVEVGRTGPVSIMSTQVTLRNQPSRITGPPAP
jgi:Tfp pilus assembly protein PilW